MAGRPTVAPHPVQFEVPVKKIIATFLLCTGVLATTSWAQTASGPAANAAPGGNSDEIVKMHQQVAAANREYDREVAAANKVFDHKKAEAKKKRNAAIEAAQSGVNQQ